MTIFSKNNDGDTLKRLKNYPLFQEIVNKTIKTLNKLNRDALTLHKHLDQFEVEVVDNQSELEDWTKIYRSAKTGQESARTNRLTLEQEVYHNKQIRDKTLSETRKRAKESAQMPDISTNRQATDFILQCRKFSHYLKIDCDRLRTTHAPTVR